MCHEFPCLSSGGLRSDESGLDKHKPPTGESHCPHPGHGDLDGSESFLHKGSTRGGAMEGPFPGPFQDSSLPHLVKLTKLPDHYLLFIVCSCLPLTFLVLL